MYKRNKLLALRLVLSELSSSIMKLVGYIMAAFLLGICMGSEDFCPEDSRLFLLDPNPDGRCPDVLPTVATPEEEDENPCAQVVLL